MSLDERVLEPTGSDKKKKSRKVIDTPYFGYPSGKDLYYQELNKKDMEAIERFSKNPRVSSGTKFRIMAHRARNVIKK